MTDRTLTNPLDRFFDSYFRLQPVNATFTGAHEHDAQLPDWSLEGLERAAAEMSALQRDLVAPHGGPGSQLNMGESDAVDRNLAYAYLEIQIAELEGNHFQRSNPALYTGEAAFAILSLMLRDFAPATHRVDALEARLQAIPTFLEKAKRTLEAGGSPPSWTKRALNECSGAVHLLSEGLPTWCDMKGVGTAREDRVTAASGPALAAFEEFASWLQTRFDTPPRRLGCGPEFFDLLLRRGHWSQRSRRDLRVELGERFDQAKAQLSQMARKATPGGWTEVQSRLADRHPSAAGYLDAYQRIWEACRQRTLECDLLTWPDFPIRYVPIPRWARTAAPFLYFLHYRSPAPWGRRAVVDYLVPPIDGTLEATELDRLLQATNDSVIKLNHVVHHGAIGHHVQNFNAYRAFSRIGCVAAVDCASRIAMFCGGTVAEGWACYATDLMDEVGFLTDLESVAEQHTRLRLLARAIVDIELHQHTMTEDEAIQLYRDDVAMSPEGASKEVTRNAMFPGTALMYWLGTQGIHDLRAQRRTADGPAFSLRAFHDRFLSYGSIPVPMIAELMSRSDTE